MDESSNEGLLDEMSTPDGDIELVAYQSRGAVWVGIRPKGWSHVDGSATRAALWVRAGSEAHYVEASAEIHRTWGVTFGAVAPEVARVAVRNEHRELFPGIVIPLPASFNEEFRAAGGLATNCERDCELVGYDGRDRLIAPHTARTGERRGLSAEESLELIRHDRGDGLRG